MSTIGTWRDWLKWHSTYIYALFVAFPEIWMHSPELQSMLPPEVVSRIAPPLAVLGFLLRIRAQSPAAAKTADDSDKAGA